MGEYLCQTEITSYLLLSETYIEELVSPDRSKRLPRPLQEAQDRPQMSQDRPIRAKAGWKESKTTPRRPKMSQKLALEAPRPLQRTNDRKPQLFEEHTEA